jgi:hypothetical protein
LFCAGTPEFHHVGASAGRSASRGYICAPLQIVFHQQSGVITVLFPAIRCLLRSVHCLAPEVLDVGLVVFGHFTSNKLKSCWPEVRMSSSRTNPL